jgi:hypothetical protein
MRHILLLLLIACIQLIAGTQQSAFAIDAYIVAGQSNGWRISHLRQGKVSDFSESNVYYFGMPCVSEPNSSQLATITSLDVRTMGHGLAQALSDRAGEDIVFIQYCRCGASVLNPAANGWWPGEDPANGKSFEKGLFASFELYMQSARLQVKKKLGEELVVKGLFWHQGESDASRDKAEFKAAVTKSFARFRSSLGDELPIVAGHIRNLGEGSRQINETLDQVAASDPLTSTVPVAGLQFEPDRNGKPDVHIARPGCHELGRNMVKSLSAMNLQAAVELAGGTIVFDDKDFSKVLSIDLYNGNNPLKKRGGKNELVTDQWLEVLSEVATIKKLDLANCVVTNAGMKLVGQVKGLEELNLTLTSVSDEGLSHLGELTELRVLGLASSQCNGTGFAHLKKLTKLENVNFHYTPLNDAGLHAISKVGVNGRLWFAHVKFTDAGAKSLANLKGLTICGIGSNHPESSGEAVASLVGLPIENLSLLDNQATPTGIAYAAKINSLRRLDIAYAPKANDESVKLIAQLPNLEELRIGGATQITDEALVSLIKAKSLKTLTLQGLNGLTEVGIAKLKTARPRLNVEVK